MGDGYMYRVDYTERVTTAANIVQVNTRAVELCDIDEEAARGFVADLMGGGQVSDVTLRRRQPMPAWETLTLTPVANPA